MRGSFLEAYSERFENPREAFLDEDLAKLGDALVNLIYSVALSKVKGKPDGLKVPNKILSEALTEADLRDLAPTRVDSHRLGDVAESIVAYAWIKGKIDVGEASNILCESISEGDFQKRRNLFASTEEGFKNLLDIISQRVIYGKS